MITKEKISKLVEEFLGESETFPVEVNVRTGNRIQVFLDSKTGVNIDLCAGLSRFIEGQFDRELEDFELEVSSAGLDYPLRIPKQFAKNEGRELDVVLLGGEKFRGRLIQSNDENFTIEFEKLVKGIDPETGKRKKNKEISTRCFQYNEIKSARLVISFKGIEDEGFEDETENPEQNSQSNEL
jgi:ribosome maturation factor RimP